MRMVRLPPEKLLISLSSTPVPGIGLPMPQFFSITVTNKGPLISWRAFDATVGFSSESNTRHTTDGTVTKSLALENSHPH